MTHADMEAFFAQRQKAWETYDPEALAEAHAEDGVLESLVGGTVRGRDAIKNIYVAWMFAFPDVQFQTEHLLVDGNRAAQFTKMTGTHRGEFCGLAATGRRFSVRCAFRFGFVDGKFAQEIRVYDFTGLLVQLGVLKATPAF